MIKKNIKLIIESNPNIWKLAWRLIQTTSVFLPHDTSYYALKYLIKDKNSLILDIGANQGISSLGFRKLCCYSKIIAFEPNKSLQVYLESVKKRINNFEYHMCGLGDKAGEFELFVPRYQNTFIHTFSSLDRKSLELAISNSYNQITQKKIFIESIKCQIFTLDSFNLNPAVIKIDAEGFEANILKGSKNTILKSRPSIIFEAVHGSSENLIEELKSHNYNIFYFDNKKNIFHKFDEVKLDLKSESKNLIAITKENTFDLKVS